MPDDAHKKAINLNCGPYFERLDEMRYLKVSIIMEAFLTHGTSVMKLSHRILALTIAGNIDRHKIPTRIVEDGELVLNYKGLP